ncbi:MAG TPA: protein kinase [Vicinamibacterales bacterium]|nr:protein kinase [Vicinamibacterales bacterium]
MSLASGTRLAQYEIVEPIGSGGMGEVYRARDLRLDRDVAIKVMAAHIASDPDMRRRFETEARAVAALSHPCILGIHELAVFENRPVAVMELLEGENLRSRLSKGPLPWRDAVRIAASVADGLAAAHARGIVHRDLKPENVFLTADSGVKILDFGLALQRAEASLDPEGPTVAATTPGTVLGTFGYMSPEQVTGEPVDARSDIFALGCVMYEMLCGRPLFAGATPRETIASLLHDHVLELTAFDPLAPGELRTIVARSVDRLPSRRFQSAGDLAMALRALLSGSGATAGGRRPRVRGRSLAVLPFVNAGADPSIEYLTDGITESIINSLSQLSGLRVVPRSLVFRYKGVQADPSTIGLTLNARTILTGRVTQQGDLVSIQAELVDTTSEAQLWGEQFRQQLTDLMGVQQEIAWQISEALRLKLTGEQKKKLRRRPTVDPEAYQDYLRGRYHWNKWTPDSFRRALEHFGRAIERDPMYAAAYAGLADTLGSMAYYGFLEAKDGFPRSKAAAQKALELDSGVAEAHVSLGLAHLFWDHDWPAAEREFRTAIELNPQFATAHALYAIYLLTLARSEEAIAEARTAQRLDPLSLLINMSVCWALHFAGRHEEAIREAQRTLDLTPGYPEAAQMLLNSYEALGRFEDAARIAGKQAYCGVKFDEQALLQAYRVGGTAGYWKQRLESLNQAASGNSSMIDYAYAVVHAHLGETEHSLERLRRLVDARAGGCVFIAVDPCLESLREHPEFKALVRQVGLPTVSAPHTVSR